jgi:hypothetical protein
MYLLPTGRRRHFYGLPEAKPGWQDFQQSIMNDAI